MQWESGESVSVRGVLAACGAVKTWKCRLPALPGIKTDRAVEHTESRSFAHIGVMREFLPQHGSSLGSASGGVVQ